MDYDFGFYEDWGDNVPNKKWAVVNKKRGSVAYMREYNYRRQAFFRTRDEARRALGHGRVYATPANGKVVRWLYNS